MSAVAFIQVKLISLLLTPFLYTYFFFIFQGPIKNQIKKFELVVLVNAMYKCIGANCADVLFLIGLAIGNYCYCCLRDHVLLYLH